MLDILNVGTLKLWCAMCRSACETRCWPADGNACEHEAVAAWLAVGATSLVGPRVPNGSSTLHRALRHMLAVL